MDDGGASCSIIIFLVLLLLEMVFYGFSSAMQNRRVTDAEEGAGEEKEAAKQQKKKEQHLGYLLDNHAKYANAMQLGVVAINLVLGALILYRTDVYFSYVTYRLAVYHITGLSGWHVSLIAGLTAVVVTILLLYIIMTFGVLIPKKAAARHPDQWVFGLIQPFYYYVRIVSPFTGLIHITAKAFLHLFGITDADDEEDVTEEEILSMVNVGHEQGILQASEAEMISNIFEYGDKEAKDIMINRNNLVAIDCTMTLQEAAAFIVEAHNSRFPVYDGTIDHIVGILHLKDVMRMQMNDRMKAKPIGKIKGLLREPVFITEKRKIDDLLKVMQAQKIQMVIVIDEYGQTAGLVALEDILEEIVGNIQDEYDEESVYIRENGADEYVIQGMMPLDELGKKLGIDFGEEPFDTANGFVISRLEHIPEEDEEFEFEYKGFSFRILEVGDKVIESIAAKKMEAQASQNNDGNIVEEVTQK
jgi:putative hemolysin